MWTSTHQHETNFSSNSVHFLRQNADFYCWNDWRGDTGPMDWVFVPGWNKNPDVFATFLGLHAKVPVSSDPIECLAEDAWLHDVQNNELKTKQQWIKKKSYVKITEKVKHKPEFLRVTTSPLRSFVRNLNPIVPEAEEQAHNCCPSAMLPLMLTPLQALRADFNYTRAI